MKGGSRPANPAFQDGEAANELPGGLYARINATFNRKLLALIDRPIPEELSNDPEKARRALLITRLGVLGSLFGVTYAVFYLLIGHLWGATIILLFSAGVLIT
ncbi:MAG TPA: hypothetical protein VKA67_08515, partial [Verrucomicrobiae bacterium]|nr:hypothetical protein [Verrucomicrobiae bacterium]